MAKNSEAPHRFNYGYQDANWDHAAGDVCFEREIDPDFYPVREKFPPSII